MFSEQYWLLQNFSKWYRPVTSLRRSVKEQDQRFSCHTLGCSILGEGGRGGGGGGRGGRRGRGGRGGEEKQRDGGLKDRREEWER